MRQNQLAEFQNWFDRYVKGFYGDDIFVNAHIKLKEKHSLEVKNQMRYLVNEIGLDISDSALAEVIAMFHDIGRFEQFRQYQTYNDVRSVNHAGLGLKVLRKYDVLNSVDPTERHIIEQAIGRHNQKSLTTDIDERTSLFARLIRDADKLDIFRVVITEHMNYKRDPENFHLEIEFPDTPGFTPEILDAVLNGKVIDYNLLKNWNDMRLLQIGWVYDMNFAAALKRVRQQKYLEQMFDFMPDGDQIQRIRRQVFDYIENRIRHSENKAG